MSDIEQEKGANISQKLTWEDGSGKSNHFAWFTDVDLGILFLPKICKDLITWKVLDG